MGIQHVLLLVATAVLANGQNRNMQYGQQYASSPQQYTAPAPAPSYAQSPSYGQSSSYGQQSYGQQASPYFPIVVAGVLSNRNKTASLENTVHSLLTRVSALEAKTMTLMDVDSNLIRFAQNPCFATPPVTDVKFVDGICVSFSDTPVTQADAAAACTALGTDPVYTFPAPDTFHYFHALRDCCTQSIYPEDTTPGNSPVTPHGVWTGIIIPAGGTITQGDTFPGTTTEIPSWLVQAINALTPAAGECIIIDPVAGLPVNQDFDEAAFVSNVACTDPHYRACVTAVDTRVFGSAASGSH